MRRGQPTRRRALRATFGIAFGSGAGSCLGVGTDGRDGTPTRAYTPATGLSVGSSAFEPGGTIPVKYTCTGGGPSPPLSIERAPEDTVALAVVVDDVDAVNAPKAHWLLWNVSADVRRIPEGVPGGETVESLGGARQGRNDTGGGGLGYSGPCPPKHDGAHSYRFVLSALSRNLAVEPGADRGTLTAALPDAQIAQARLFGTYDRKLHVEPDDPITGG
jgi:Raf kinase inhibitor-like YbhB/YbcL family protein